MLSSPAIIAQPVELDTIRPADAVALNGRYVRATFTVAFPPDHTELTTLVGCGFDEVERAAHLPKELTLSRGDTVTAAGYEVVSTDWAAVGPVLRWRVGWLLFGDDHPHFQGERGG